MDSPADEPNVAAEPPELAVLRELRATPGIFAQIANWTGTELALQKQLRSEYSDALTRAALQLAGLRTRAREKFSRASELWCDRQSLEQSTNEAVAQYKAERFAECIAADDPGLPVVDVCAGIGGDALSLARELPVLAVERDPLIATLLTWNAELYGVAERVQTRVVDARELDLAGRWLHLDPDRRPGTGGRVWRIEDYEPELDQLRAWMAAARGGALKLSPACNFAGKFHDLSVETELISLRGECKEATIWFGDLVDEPLWRATVLPEGATIAGYPSSALAEQSALRGYLYDPDPAVVRAGLVDLLAETEGLARLDREEEYLTSEELFDTPFAQAFAVVAELPNNDREIRAQVKAQHWHEIEIKCRHVPVKAAQVRQKLTLDGTGSGTLFIAKIQGRTRAILARRVAPGTIAASQ